MPLPGLLAYSDIFNIPDALLCSPRLVRGERVNGWQGLQLPDRCPLPQAKLR